MSCIKGRMGPLTGAHSCMDAVAGSPRSRKSLQREIGASTRLHLPANACAYDAYIRPHMSCNCLCL